MRAHPSRQKFISALRRQIDADIFRRIAKGIHRIFARRDEFNLVVEQVAVKHDAVIGLAEQLFRAVVNRALGNKDGVVLRIDVVI